MSLLTRIFGFRGKTADPAVQAAEVGPKAAPGAVKVVPSSRERMSITLDILKQLFPIRTLSEDELNAFVLERKAEVYGPGTILFNSGEPIESIHYLLEGTVLMDVGGGKTYEIGADTAKARFPLCCGKQYSATAYAQTEIQILRVASKIMSQGIVRDESAQTLIDPNDKQIPEAVRESRLFQAFSQYYGEEELRIPSLPDVAIKLRQAIQHDIGIDEAAKIVQLDPAVAAKLVHVANSPLYLPARPINNCQNAVLRLGLTATRNLVTSFCLRQIFSCKDPYISRILHEQWKTSINLSSLCYVLAAENEGVNEEEALLAGLIADIGVVPFLYFAENFPREYWSPDEIESAIPYVRGPVGAFLLKKWGFPADLIEIPVLAEDWYHDSGNALALSDVVILSRLHSCIGTSRMAELPAINSVPAYSKLKDDQLSPTHALNALHEAKDRIHEAMKFFET
ncbi:HDOD domain-containing protein [Methylocaldum sp.]|uniref:HDOD domain-containing protein n=1 Tax=Methylocaldum sp. TaxID=1969727 RepID=UPI002D4EC1AF|nr:HDOD domain-containing protein [Methylocaldum sp.]HYE35083.1 HDOD domain-containing protein [Methylocaldum sp.]